jgi:hypothetical protein
MSAIALCLLVILALATATFYVAGGLGHGSPWARDVCGLSRDLCDHPAWGAAATGGMAVLYLVLRSLRY